MDMVDVVVAILSVASLCGKAPLQVVEVILQVCFVHAFVICEVVLILCACMSDSLMFCLVILRCCVCVVCLYSVQSFSCRSDGCCRFGFTCIYIFTIVAANNILL